MKIIIDNKGNAHFVDEAPAQVELHVSGNVIDYSEGLVRLTEEGGTFDKIVAFSSECKKFES